jgi:TrmH family RNA methyltransferase
MQITSTQNPRLKHLFSLSKKKTRNKENLFIIEGKREITRALACGLRLHSLFESIENSESLIDTISTTDNFYNYQLPPDLFAKASYRANTTGHLAIFFKPNTDLKQFDQNFGSKIKDIIVLVIESPEKPGNVGALLRTADAVGVDCIIITNPNLDLFNPNVIRAAAGTFFSHPIYLADNQTTINLLQQNKIKIICTTPKAKQFYHEIKYTKPFAIVAGAEDQGLSNQMLNTADQTIKIPMRGVADSLNLSVATAVVLYEATK